jgi:hypothetical protein
MATLHSFASRGLHAVTVEFDFVQPLVAFRRRVDELGQLRPDPCAAGQGGRRAAGRAIPCAMPERERGHRDGCVEWV